MGVSAGPGAGGADIVQIKATPLEVNGILYFTLPDHAWAVDARTAPALALQWESTGGIHIGNRGFGMYGDWLYFETPDNYLVSLNAKDGTERWHVRDRRREAGVFLHARADGDSQSHHRRRGRRFAGCSRIPGIARSGNRASAMALEHDAAQGRTGLGNLAESRCDGAWRRHDLDAGHLRSRTESVLPRHRQSESGDGRAGPQGQQLVDLFDRGA